MSKNPFEKGYPERYRIFTPAERAKIILASARRAINFMPEQPLAPHGDHLPTRIKEQNHELGGEINENF